MRLHFERYFSYHYYCFYQFIYRRPEKNKYYSRTLDKIAITQTAVLIEVN